MVAMSDPDLATLAAALSTESLDLLVTRLADSMAAALQTGQTLMPAASSRAPAPESYLSSTMLPSYIYALPTGLEKGTFISIDVGGSTLRIAVVSFEPPLRHMRYHTSEPLDAAIRNIDGRSFFLWLASQLQSVLYVAEANGWIEESITVPVGLTWSFPLDQMSVSSGKILSMGKGFATMGNDILGWDLRTVFQQSCADVGVNIDLRAVVNDSVATILSHMHTDRRCKIGVIVGTGVNASVKVPITCLDEEKLSRCNPRDLERYAECILNTELSMFGTDILPRTRWDIELDAANEKPGFQPFEMMVSGRYIAEVARYIVRDTVLKFRPSSAMPAGLDKLYGLDASTMSVVERELDIHFASQQFLARHPCKEGRLNLTIEEMKFIRAAFYAVSSRAAAVVAAGILALAVSVLPPSTPGDGEEIVVAATGSVIEKYFGFRLRVQEFLNLLGHRRGKKIVLAVTEDSSIWGAAVAAAIN
ncbi:hypothetical protein V1508DRAFT_169160 [Lipomyces doorenjongii]|uniref:uncharacterized protein n=1 Tax=Lipomyces doorenjongii TaxID=383834 RepID=UPI0034CF896C